MKIIERFGVKASDVEFHARGFLKYSEDEARDDHGMWTTGGGDSNPIARGDVDRLYPIDFLSVLSPEEIKSVHSYQRNSYLTYNGLLREGDQSKWVDSGNKAEALESIKNIDSAIEKAPLLPENTSVFRAMDQGVVSSLNEQGIGTVMTDKGYSSTTLNDMRGLSPEAAQSYANRGQAIVEIQMTDKTSGLVVDQTHTAQSLSNLNDLLQGEHEVILPRGTSYSFQGYDAGKQVYVLRRLT